MKQKIKNSCFSKMKRVALALFAALCVSSVWARNAKFFFPQPAIDLTASGMITITGASVYSWQYNDELKCTDTLKYCIEGPQTECSEWKTIEVVPEYLCSTVAWHGFVEKYPSATLRGGYYEYQIPSDEFYVGCTVKVKYVYTLNKEIESEIDYNDDGIKRSGWEADFTFNTAGVISTAAEWTNNSPTTFIVSGEIAGENITKVCVKYELISTKDEIPATLTKEAFAEIENGRYSLVIPYDISSDDSLVWSVSSFISNDGVSEEVLYVKGGESVFRRNRRDDSTVLYTWNGNGDETSWLDFRNWSASTISSYGYPGTKGGAWYYSMVKFDGDANIDLGGGSFGFKDDGAFTFAENTTVTFTDGHIYAASGHLGSGGSDAIGANGATIIFKNIGLYSFDGKDFSNKGCQEVTPQSNTTLIFEGDFNKNSTTYNDSSAWRYHPKNTYSNTKFIFKDGEIRCGYVSSSDYKMSLSGTHKVEITNAVFRINTDMSGARFGVADEIVFRDGVGDGSRQARLWIYNGSANWDGNIKLPSVIDIKLPETPYSTAYIQAHSFTNTPNSTIKIDATDYVKGAKVPLIKLFEASTYIPTLKVFVNGEESTARNAELIWVGNTLYYQQTSLNVAKIGNTEYATLGAAVEAATSGATITVLNDCTADTACVIANKTLTIDLNGKKVKANDTDAATDGNGVFWVQAGGVLTLEDSSETKAGTVNGNGGNDYKMAIWADGGKVVINGGNYVNENNGTHTQYDLIYAKNGGEIVINGGTFKCDTPRWTLNSHNTKTGRFVVTGGKFYQYNPTNFDTDEAVTTWCDAKYRAEADGDWFVVKEGYIVTEASAVTVTADTEADALEQVDFSVTTPEGVDATAYKNYFKLVATETAEGSKTWTVALALKDELKPVIAETTPAITFNEDGTVTVNIKNELPGLNYGVRYATTVEAVETTAPVPGFTVTPVEGDTAGFFKVVVDFAPIVVPEAE